MPTGTIKAVSALADFSTRCDSFKSVFAFLQKSTGIRFLWDSDVKIGRGQVNLLPQKMLFLRVLAKGDKSFLNQMAVELRCQYQLLDKGIEIYPSASDYDTKCLLSHLILQLQQLKTGDETDAGLNLNRKVKSERVLVEYGSPNIAKPLHMGHLRSTVTGHYIARICKSAGHHATSMCFLGDWGTQFGVLHAGLMEICNSDNATVEESTRSLDIGSLLKIYIEASKKKDTDKDFSKAVQSFSALLEKSDPHALKIWSIIRKKTLDHLENVWKQLGINYDVIQGESEFPTTSEYTKEALRRLQEQGLLSNDSGGCIYANVPSISKDTKTSKLASIPLIKGDGSSLYLLRDTGAALQRSENIQFDRMIYVVDKDQTLHFLNLFHLLSRLGFQRKGDNLSGNTEGSSRFPKYVQHVSFGKIEGMSTRGGSFVLLSDALRDGTEVMEQLRKESPNTRWSNESDANISLQLAISAFVVYSLKSRRNRDFKFDWAEATRSVGETGIKLQYTHARLKSLEQNLHFDPIVLGDSELFASTFDIEYIMSDPVALDLTLHLLNFENSFWASYEEFEPCILLTYLFKLCDKVSKGLKDLPVKTEASTNISRTRLLLFALSRQLLAAGMNIIGIKALDQI